MLDYLRIMLNARLAKMDERGASAVEYGLLIAGIAALIVVVVLPSAASSRTSSARPARASARAPPVAPPAADLSTHEEAADPLGSAAYLSTTPCGTTGSSRGTL